MLKIYTDFVTKFNYDENGQLFNDGYPRMFFKSTETVQWQICASTSPLSDTQTPEDWPKYTGYADYSAIGAYLTADNNYTLKILGSLKNAVTSGSVSSIIATIPSASLATIPASGVLNLFDAEGGHEAFSYDSRSISGTTVTFGFDSPVTAENSYAADSELDVGESVYMQASLDTQNSDTANGTFVFDITAYSEKLRRAIVYSNVKQLDISGLELAIFNIDAQENTVSDIERYMLESFTIRSGVADTSLDAQVSESVTNPIADIVDTIIASGLQFQFSADGSSWHDTQVASTDLYMRVRNAAVGGTWSNAINIPQGADGVDCYVYIGYASAADGTGFSLTPSASLKYISFLTSSVILNPPTLSDFTTAGSDFMKYIGDDGLTPTIDGTTKNWKIGTTDTGVCAEGVALQALYSTASSTSDPSTWHGTWQSGDKYVRFSVDRGTTWSSAMKFIGDDAIPLKQQYSQTGSIMDWHDTATSSDIYIRFSTDNGETWSEALQIVPFPMKVQYSASDGGGYHNTFASGDKFVRFSTDNGTTWTSGMKFIGDDGLSFSVDATGAYADRSTYDTEARGFSYLVTTGTNLGKIYFKLSSTSGDWTDGIQFITPPEFKMQYSLDGSDWHNTALSTDLYIRFSADDGASWTTALQFRGEANYLYVGYASDSSGADFSLTPSAALTYRAEFHSSTYIASPALSDFTTAGAVWLKYIGANWLYGNTAPSSSIGSNGDIYLNTATGNLYRKANGEWSLLINIIGPQGTGITLKGEYSGSTAYAANDAVTYEGSLFVARTSTTGNAPPSLPTTQNTYWTNYVQKGDAGSGEENVIEAVTFNGTPATVTNKTAAITATIPTVPLEGVQLNGTDLTISSKKVNVQAVTGVTFNGASATVTNGVAAITATIPTVNNATLTITQGGTTKGTFTANASQNVTIALDAGGGGGGVTTSQAKKMAMIFG